MPRPALLIPIAALGLVLAGCDPAVQARYHPTTVEEAFGPFSHVGSVDNEVYELPATPPAVAQSDARPRSCRPPRQTLIQVGIVGLREDPHPFMTLEPTVMVASEEPPLHSPPPMPPYAIAGWEPAMKRGVKEPINEPLDRPALEPGRSIYRNQPTLMGTWRRDDWSWCNEAANLR